MEGLPLDALPREVAHIFRPFTGFESLRIIVKDTRHPLCFVEFQNAFQSVLAMKHIQGYRVDLSDPGRGLVISFAMSRDRRERGRGGHIMHSRAASTPSFGLGGMQGSGRRSRRSSKEVIFDTEPGLMGVRPGMGSGKRRGRTRSSSLPWSETSPRTASPAVVAAKAVVQEAAAPKTRDRSLSDPAGADAEQERRDMQRRMQLERDTDFSSSHRAHVRMPEPGSHVTLE